jgi:hypothetical protein
MTRNCIKIDFENRKSPENHLVGFDVTKRFFLKKSEKVIPKKAKQKVIVFNGQFLTGNRQNWLVLSGWSTWSPIFTKFFLFGKIRDFTSKKLNPLKNKCTFSFLFLFG